MMDGLCALILMGNVAWYRWSALKVAAASSQEFRMRVIGAIRDVRALDTRLLRGLEAALGLFVTGLGFHGASQGVSRSIYSVFLNVNMVYGVRGREGSRGRVVH